MPTHEIKDLRRRLAALSTAGVRADSVSPATSLADCRALQGRLRELKREVLARISTLRTEIQERASESLRTRPSLADGWKRRKEDAKKLLADVQERVIGLVDGKHGDVLEAWSNLSEEIDARLARLERIESRLETRVARAADSAPGARSGSSQEVEAESGDADDLYVAAGAAARQPEKEDPAEEAVSDDVYAAVGAATRKGEKAAAYCPHCGKGVEPDDRFCRRCGRRIQND